MPVQVRAPDCITFDCYGTLVRWHEALRTAMRAALVGGAEGVDPDDTQVADLAGALRSASMDRQQRAPYRDYKTVLRSSLNEVMAERGYTPKPDAGDAFLSPLRDVAPHPETPAALRRLRERFRLAIISNTDDDLIAGTVASIGVPIDFVVTAQQARAYKPDHRLFLHAHAVIGFTPEQTIHVGMGQVTDLKVCHELGIRAVWINRLGEPPDPAWTPMAVLPDLSGLPDLLFSQV